MDVTMDVENFQYSGTQELVYTNNSPDTLKRVFYHLYFNAFQPGSEMDVRLTTISDADSRMVRSFKGPDGIEKKQSKISELKPNEIRSEEHTSELQSRPHLVCRLLLEKKKTRNTNNHETKRQKHER